MNAIVMPVGYSLQCVGQALQRLDPRSAKEVSVLSRFRETVAICVLGELPFAEGRDPRRDGPKQGKPLKPPVLAGL